MAQHQTTADRLRQRRRAQERTFNETRSFLDQHQNTQRLHDWEQRTQQQIERREVDAFTQKLLHDDEQDLHTRKAELKSLYNGEMDVWKENLRNTLEVTQEQRMEQIRSRAYQLKEKREAERREFVKECYERQWRDACDDVRAIDSKATLNRIVKDREIAIESKRAKQQQRESTKDDVDAMCLIAKDESDEQQAKARASRSFRQALDHQVQMKQSQAEAMAKQTQRDEEEQLRKLALLEQRAQDSARKAAEKSRMDGAMMLKETKERARSKEELLALEKEQKKLLLERRLGQERRAIEAEEAKKDLGKNAAHEYVMCLREQAKEEQATEMERENVRLAELSRLSQINDDKMQLGAEQRRRWMEEIDTSRQEQIRRKQIEAEAAQKEADQEAAEMKAALLRAEAEDADNEEADKALRLENMLANKETMEKRARERSKALEEKHQIQHQIRKEEAAYRRRLEQQRSGSGVRDLL